VHSGRPLRSAPGAGTRLQRTGTDKLGSSTNVLTYLTCDFLRATDRGFGMRPSCPQRDRLRTRYNTAEHVYLPSLARVFSSNVLF
jgi:hypothetical protein